MSEPEKVYTLPEVVGIVRGHAEALGAAGKALEATEGKDPEVLAMVGERALKASEDLWAIDSFVGFNQPVDGYNQGLFDVWYSGGSDGGAVGRARNVLPLLVLAVEGADTFTGGRDVAILEPWRWCQQHTETIAEDLMKWVMEHEKDAEPATTVKEPRVQLPAFVEFTEAVPSLSIEEGDRVWVTSYSATLTRSLPPAAMKQYLHLTKPIDLRTEKAPEASP